MTLSSAHLTADDAVMAALDDTGAALRFIIADITRDEAWLSMPASEAPVIEDWC